MNKKYFLLIIIFVLCFSFESIAQIPGTSGDPLVTKSYLDFVTKFKKVEAKSGSVIKAETGAMIVVTSGQIKLELKKGGYVIDLTTGRKITSNSILQSFHLIMVAEGSLCCFKVSKDTSLMALGINDGDEE